MKKYYFILLLILSICFLSCQKQIEITFDNYQPKLVLNSLFTKDSIFKVHIGITSDFNQKYSDEVDDAVCLLYANNVLLDTLTYYSNGFYLSSENIKPKELTVYQIVATTVKNGKIQAQDILPETVNVLNIERKDSVLYNEDGFLMSEVSITLKDNINIKNFYEIQLFAYYQYDSTLTYDKQYYTKKLIPESKDIILTNEGLLDYYPEIYPFSDVLFNGKEQTIKIDYMVPMTMPIENNLIKEYKLIVMIRSISVNLYDFRRKLIIHSNNQHSDIWDGMSEPISMFTNIQGGFGIFAGFQTRIDTLSN